MKQKAGRLSGKLSQQRLLGQWHAYSTAQHSRVWVMRRAACRRSKAWIDRSISCKAQGISSVYTSISEDTSGAVQQAVMAAAGPGDRRRGRQVARWRNGSCSSNSCGLTWHGACVDGRTCMSSVVQSGIDCCGRGAAGSGVSHTWPLQGCCRDRVHARWQRRAWGSAPAADASLLPLALPRLGQGHIAHMPAGASERGQHY